MKRPKINSISTFVRLGIGNKTPEVLLKKDPSFESKVSINKTESTNVKAFENV